MNDTSRFNYKDYPIYLIIIYDCEENQIQFYQKIPVVNYVWMKAQINTQIKLLLYTRKKTGKTLYNELIEYNFTREIKVTSLMMNNKSALIFFYNSSIDFYQMGPIVLNLRDCIQSICGTNKIDSAKLKKNYFNINAIVSDTLGGINCSNRVLIHDIEKFSGNSAIFNEKCFMHMMKSPYLQSMFHKFVCNREYCQERNKNRSIMEKRNNIILSTKFKVNYHIMKHNQMVNKDRFDSFSQNIKMPQYTMPKETAILPQVPREEILRNSLNRGKSAIITNERERKHISGSNFINHNNTNIINVQSPSLDFVDLDFDTLKNKANNNISIISPMQISQDLFSVQNIDTGSYPDISMINQRIEKKNDLPSNNGNKMKGQKKEIFSMADDFDFETIAKINQSVIQMSNKQHSVNNSPGIPSLSQSVVVNYQRNEHRPASPPPIVNLLEYKSSSNISSSFVSPHHVMSLNRNTSQLERKFQSSNIQLQEFNKIEVIPYANTNPNISKDYNIQKFNTNVTSNTLYANFMHNNNNISASTANTNMTSHGNLAHSPVPQNRLELFNSVPNNRSVSPFNPSMRGNYQDFNLNMRMVSISNLSQMNDNNRYNNINTNSSNFSEDDMSFLSNNSVVMKEYDDNINLNKINPELTGDLKEKYFYSFQKGSLIKSDAKGYIGFIIKKPFTIKKKIFSLMILQSRWKDIQFFSNKEYDKTLLEKLTEVDFRMECKNVSQDLKIITYTPNPLKIENLVAIKVKNDYNPSNRQVSFEINFSFNPQYISNVYRMVFKMFMRKNAVGNNNLPQQQMPNKFQILQSNHQPTKMNDWEYQIHLTTVVPSIAFTIESTIPNPIEKIQFCFEMKDCIPSHNDIRINYNNSKANQFSLKINKLALVNYDYLL